MTVAVIFCLIICYGVYFSNKYYNRPRDTNGYNSIRKGVYKRVVSKYQEAETISGDQIYTWRG